MSDADNPSDKGNTGAAPDSAAIQKLIDDAVGKALAARLPRVKNTEETIAKMVADAVSKLAPVEKPVVEQAPANSGDQGQERLNLKALDEKYKQLQARLEASEKARQAAEQQARDTSMRGQVQSKLAAKLGADNPLVPMLMDSLYDVKKRFVEQDGRLGVKFQADWGDDVKPLEEGINALFDGELKHFLQQSKAQQLPPSSVGRNAFGQPVQQLQQPQNGGRVNPVLGGIAQILAEEGRGEAAQIIMNDAQKLAQQPLPSKK